MEEMNISLCYTPVGFPGISWTSAVSIFKKKRTQKKGETEKESFLKPCERKSLEHRKVFVTKSRRCLVNFRADQKLGRDSVWLLNLWGKSFLVLSSVYVFRDSVSASTRHDESINNFRPFREFCHVLFLPYTNNKSVISLSLMF